MTIQELIEAANASMIGWKTATEAEELITGLQAAGYAESEIEKVLYLMDDGWTAEAAAEYVRS